MPPCNMNVLFVKSAQSNLAEFSSFVMSGQTIIAVIFFIGAGTVFRLAYHQWAAAASPADDDRALLSRPCVRPVSKIAFRVAGVNSGRVYACPTAARPRAPALSPVALVSDEDYQKGKDNGGSI